MTDLTKLTIAETLNALKEKKFSAVELTNEYLSRMSGCRDLNAYVLETPETALEQAKIADEKYRNGTNGALEGIPLGIKDLFCTKDIRITSKEDMCNLFDQTNPFEERSVASLDFCDGFVYQSEEHYTYNDYLYQLNKKKADS